MKNYKLIISYDGTDYHGWQVQKNHNSIAQVLQNVFHKTFHQKITLLGASRTDAGVHAKGQVARFRTNLQLSPKRMKTSWNNALPQSIVIKSLIPVQKTFHPHHNVIQKTYEYLLFIKRPSPFISRYGWHWKFIHQVDLGKLRLALSYFVGTHDFRAFCTQEKEKSTIRTITNIRLSIVQSQQAYRITISGPGFLRYQIRRMIGAALDIARKNDLSPEYIKKLLKSHTTQQAYTRAAAQGLCLKHITYEK